MEPIVSPWLVYLIGVVDNIQALFILAGTIGFILSVLFAFPLELIQKAPKTMISIICFFFFVLLASAIIPDSKTLAAMLIAKQATPNNIAKVVQSGKDIHETIKQDIIDILREGKK